MLKIGSHVGMGSPNYYLGSVKEALSYNATTFMFYTGAPQNSIRTPLEKLKILEAIDLMRSNNINPQDVVVHAPYLINLANLNEEKSKVSFSLLLTEVNRTLAMGCRYLVLHPGASMDYDRNEAMNQIAHYLNIAINNNPGIIILLETMAGKGSEVGKTFEEIAYIIERIENKNGIGVCLDTCHIHDGGYDLGQIDEVLHHFDKVIGLDYLKVIHVNDSKNTIAAHKDRHENFGFGYIGFDKLINIIYHPLLEGKIFILETPWVKQNEKDKISYPPYKFEIETIRNKTFDPELKEKVIKNYLK